MEYQWNMTSHCLLLSTSKYQIPLSWWVAAASEKHARLFKPLGVVCEDILKNLVGLQSCTW